MSEIVLVRPGSTEFDRQGRIVGTLDIPLTEQGREQAEHIAEALEGRTLEAVYTSPCCAAVDTGEAIADAMDVKLKQVEKLRNLDHGLWQGMQVEEVRIRQPKVYREWQEHPENVCPPEGESLYHALSRVDAALAKICKRHKHGTVALVVPEPLASIVRNRLNGAALGDLWKGSCACGSWEIIQANELAASHG